MSGRLTRAGYAKLIAEDLAWLLAMPIALEREHIGLVLKESIDLIYKGSADESAMEAPQLEPCPSCDGCGRVDTISKKGFPLGSVPCPSCWGFGKRIP